MDQPDLDKIRIKKAFEAAKAKELNSAEDHPSNEGESSPFLIESNMNTMENQKGLFSVVQGYILIGLLSLVAILLVWNQFFSNNNFEYKILSVQAQFSGTSNVDVTSELNSSKIRPTSVNLKDEELSILGKEGWELVGTFLEVETTHPNYGNSEYVSGIQPNIRPQKVVLIFKRPL